MKRGPVAKLYKGNKTTSKKFDDKFMLENCDVIVIFPIYGQFGAIRKRDSGHILCETYIFINTNLLSYKNTENKTKRLLRQFSHYCFE